MATTDQLVLNAGTYNIAAVYIGPAAGNSNDTGSTSPTALTLTIAPVATATTFDFGVDEATFFTFSVLDVDSGLPSPTGTIQIWNMATTTPTLLGTFHC